MDMKTTNTVSATLGTRIEGRYSSRRLQWINGGVHWISAVVLLYAFVSNGESNGAMTNSTAMRGEVRLGLVIAFVFLLRFVWVSSKRSIGGRWTFASLPASTSWVRRLMHGGIYLGVAGSVISGLCIAYLRPGALVIPHTRGLTDKPSLNAAIEAHVTITNALEWLCAFHVLYFVWLWAKTRTRWGHAAETWLDRTVSRLELPFLSRLVGQKSARPD